jgi:AcrR family transcriptional regulator
MATLESAKPEEPPSRREREKAAHRKEIMQAAVTVFARKGFASATIDEIAQEAEFSKGAVYLHFASKEELLSTILIDMLQNTVVAGMHRILTGGRSLREELTELFRDAAEFAFTHQLHMSASMPLALSQFSGLSADARARINESHQEMWQILLQRLAKARGDGELRGVALDAVAGLIHGTLDSMVMTRWGFDTVDELRQAGDDVIEILFGGIGTRKEQQ